MGGSIIFHFNTHWKLCFRVGRPKMGGSIIFPSEVTNLHGGVTGRISWHCVLGLQHQDPAHIHQSQGKGKLHYEDAPWRVTHLLTYWHHKANVIIRTFFKCVFWGVLNVFVFSQTFLRCYHALFLNNNSIGFFWKMLFKCVFWGVFNVFVFTQTFLRCYHTLFLNKNSMFFHFWGRRFSNVFFDVFLTFLRCYHTLFLNNNSMFLPYSQPRTPAPTCILNP